MTGNPQDTPDSATYRLEIRWDFTGSAAEARAEAQRVAGTVGGEVTAIFDEDWNEL